MDVRYDKEVYLRESRALRKEIEALKSEHTKQLEAIQAERLEEAYLIARIAYFEAWADADSVTADSGWLDSESRKSLIHKDK